MQYLIIGQVAFPLKFLHSIYIRTVSSKRLLSTLLNQLKLVYGSFGAKQHEQYI